MGLTRKEFSNMCLGEFIEREYYHEYTLSLEHHRTRLLMSCHGLSPKDSDTPYTLQQLIPIPLFDNHIIDPIEQEEDNTDYSDFEPPSMYDVFPDTKPKE